MGSSYIKGLDVQTRHPRREVGRIEVHRSAAGAGKDTNGLARGTPTSPLDGRSQRRLFKAHRSYSVTTPPVGWVVVPPSTTKVCPVTHEAASEQRKTAARAISSGSPSR
jgi:hypothetical protein